MPERQFTSAQEAIQFAVDQIGTLNKVGAELRGRIYAQRFAFDILVRVLRLNGVIDPEELRGDLEQMVGVIERRLGSFDDPSTVYQFERAIEELKELIDSVRDSHQPGFSVIRGGKDDSGGER